MEYYKVVKVLKNGARVSCMIPRSFKPLYTVYARNGEIMTVDSAMCFRQLDNAELFLQTSGLFWGRYTYEIWSCTGEKEGQLPKHAVNILEASRIIKGDKLIKRLVSAINAREISNEVYFAIEDYLSFNALWPSNSVVLKNMRLKEKITSVRKGL